MRSIKEQAHNNAAEGAGDGNCKDPCEEQKTNSLEINCFQCTVAETDADGSTSDAHGGRDRERELRECKDGDGGTHLHGAA